MVDSEPLLRLWGEAPSLSLRGGNDNWGGAGGGVMARPSSCVDLKRPRLTQKFKKVISTVNK